MKCWLGLPAPRLRRTVEWRTGPPVLVAVSGGKPGCPARVRTPFILERANPSRDGDAKRWASGVKPARDARVPEVAKLPKGWAGEEPVRPRAQCRSRPARRARTAPGTGLAGYAEACPA